MAASLVARLLALAGLALGIIVTLTTLPSLPHFSPWPVVAGLAVWTVGKYLLCPLRWYAISMSDRTLSWHLAVQAEAEILGLLTPGHLGGDVWRVRRLAAAGLPRLTAAVEITTDKLIGAAGGLLGGALAAATLPLPAALAVLGAVAGAVIAGLVVRRVRPRWYPRYRLPTRSALAGSLLLTAVDQLTTVVLLLATLQAVGHRVGALAAFDVFAASQLAGVIPGPQGASPKDGVLVAGLTALGVPWATALGAVTLKAMVAFIPGILIGGGALLLRRIRGEPVALQR